MVSVTCTGLTGVVVTRGVRHVSPGATVVGGSEEARGDALSHAVVEPVTAEVGSLHTLLGDGVIRIGQSLGLGYVHGYRHMTLILVDWLSFCHVTSSHVC